jgi:nucleoside-diphosphate-sugar epimerase
MIIGKGLLAQSLTETKHNSVTLFCSGVSDSLEKNPAAFERERILLMQQNKDKTLYYFSTISIFNPAHKNSLYVKHKIAMEELIRTDFKNFLIIRLPNVIGFGGNKSNLFPFLYDAIQFENEIKIHTSAYRYLFAAHDLSGVVQLFIDQALEGEINVCYPSPPTALEIYQFLCSLKNKTPHFIEGHTEKIYQPDNSRFMQLIASSPLALTQNWRDIIRYYAK